MNAVCQPFPNPNPRSAYQQKLSARCSQMCMCASFEWIPFVKQSHFSKYQVDSRAQPRIREAYSESEKNTPSPRRILRVRVRLIARHWQKSEHRSSWHWQRTCGILESDKYTEHSVYILSMLRISGEVGVGRKKLSNFLQFSVQSLDMRMRAQSFGK